MYNYKIFHNFPPECEKILKDMENRSYLNFFQNFEFLKKLVQKSENVVKIIVIFKEDEAIAVLPFEIKKYFIFNVLQWLGTDYADYCNPILSKNFNTNLDKTMFLVLWKKILKELDKFDLIFLNNQLSEIEKILNPFVSHFPGLLYEKVYFINLPNTFLSYLDIIKKKDKKHYYEIHRTMIKNSQLNEKLSVKFIVEDSLSNNIDIKKTIRIKKNYLNKKKIKDSFTNKFIDLYNELNQEKNIRFVNMHLKINDKTVSSCLGIIFNEVFYYFIPTIYLSEFDRFKPGKILILEIIKWCINNNIKRFDFGLGNENYKKHFSNKEIYSSKYLSFHSLKGFILYLNAIVFLKIKRLWL